MDDEASNLSTFDIYSDLLEQENRGASVEQLEKINAENEDKLKELTEQLKTLQTQNSSVVRENQILRTNISQLFKTAEAELRRKDRQLEELANRKPRYWRENDLKGSINNRLRDLRKNSRVLPRPSNGVHHNESSRDVPETKPCDSSYPDWQKNDLRKPCQPESEDQGSSSTSTRCERKYPDRQKDDTRKRCQPESEDQGSSSTSTRCERKYPDRQKDDTRKPCQPESEDQGSSLTSTRCERKYPDRQKDDTKKRCQPESEDQGSSSTSTRCERKYPDRQKDDTRKPCNPESEDQGLSSTSARCDRKYPDRQKDDTKKPVKPESEDQGSSSTSTRCERKYPDRQKDDTRKVCQPESEDQGLSSTSARCDRKYPDRQKDDTRKPGKPESEDQGLSSTSTRCERKYLDRQKDDTRKPGKPESEDQGLSSTSTRCDRKYPDRQKDDTRKPCKPESEDQGSSSTSTRCERKYPDRQKDDTRKPGKPESEDQGSSSTSRRCQRKYPDRQKDDTRKPCQPESEDQGLSSTSTRCDRKYPDQQKDDTRKVCRQESEDLGSSSTSTRCERKSEVSSSRIASNPLPEQNTKGVNEEKHTETNTVNSDVNSLGTNSSESYHRKDDTNCSKRSEKHESVRPSVKQSSLSTYRIPKKSTSRGDHSVTTKEDTRCGKSLSVHRVPDSSHRSSHSPSRCARDFAKLSKYNHSPSHDHPSDPSKSDRLERNDLRSKIERSSGRKRRLSSEIGSSTPYDSRQDCAFPRTAPQKKHKLESTVLVIDRGFSTSDKRKPAEVVTDRMHSRSRKEAASSHREKTKVTDARRAIKEESSRKRHTSDRKNRSLKRARETLHKMHSTPRKDKHHNESERHKHRKHDSKSKVGDLEAIPHHEYINDRDLIDRSKKKLVLSPHLEDGEIQDSDFDDSMMDVHQEGLPDDHDVSASTDFKAADSKASGFKASDFKAADSKAADSKASGFKASDFKAADSKASDSKASGFKASDFKAADSKAPDSKASGFKASDFKATNSKASDSKASERVQESSKEQCLHHEREDPADTPALYVGGDVNSKDNTSVPERTTTQSYSVQKEDIKTEIIPTEIVPKYEASHPKEGPEVEGSDKVVDNNPDLCSTPCKTLTTLTQPDPATCVYASEHETVLICMPSQDEDSSSEDTSQSVSLTSSLSTSHQSDANSGTPKPKLEGNIDEQCHSTSGVIADDPHDKLKMETQATQSPANPAESESPVKRNFESISGTKTQQIDSVSDASDLQTIPVLDSSSLTADSTQKNTDDSFRERILTAFGSTSFLDSDDLESSKEGVIRSPGGVLELKVAGATHPQDTFAQTVLELFGGDSLLGIDDLESCSGVPSVNTHHQAQSKSEEAKMLQVEESVSSPVKPQADVRTEQSTVERSNGSILAGTDAVSGSSISINEDQEAQEYMDIRFAPCLQQDQLELSTSRDLESFGSNSIETDASETGLCPKESIFTQGDDQAEAATPQDGFNILESDHEANKSSDDGKLEVFVPASQDGSGLAVETRDVLKDDATYGHDAASSAFSPGHSVSEKIDKQVSASNYPSVSDTTSPCQKQVEGSSDDALVKDEKMKEPEKQHSASEVEDVVDISIDLPSFDALSCSASPAHSSLLGDSDSSSHSNLDDRASWDGRSDKLASDYQHSDREDKCDVRSQFADRPQNGTPSETSNLSDGEVVSSSDSEVEAPSKSPAHLPSERRSKQSKSGDSKRRSRPRDDLSSRQKDRGHSSKYSKGTHSEVSDKAKFFEEKRRNLEERRKTREQHVSHSGNKPRGDALPSRKDHRDEKRVLTKERRDVRGQDKDYRHQERKRTALREESNSRHGIKTHSSRRHDSPDLSRSQRKPERREVISEQRGRDNRGRDQRRRKDY